MFVSLEVQRSEDFAPLFKVAFHALLEDPYVER